ncbi:MAG: hypothetical protein Q4G08_05970 [Capnocytophaga sp.]|nr:hypothetical protein [Capnocytophaga sp.]
MATRFKNEQYCSSTSWGEDYCYWESIPIREWLLEPSVRTHAWTAGTAIPSSDLFSVTFPEVEALEEYKNITKFRYAVEMERSGAEAAVLGNAASLENIALPQNGKVPLTVSYRDFASLPMSDTNIVIRCSVYGTKNIRGDVFEEELESRNIKITIKRQEKSDTPYITTDKNEYFITYNKTTKTVTGSDGLTVFLHHINTFDSASLTVGNTEVSFINGREAIREAVPSIFRKWELYPAETDKEGTVSYNAAVRLVYHVTTKEQYTHFTGATRERDVVTRYQHETNVKIHVTYTDGTDLLEADPDTLEFTLKRHEDKQASGTIRLTLPAGTTPEITQSEWITPVLQSSEISFTTAKASQLQTGKNKGFIKISAGGKTKIVSITAIVEETIINGLNGVLFCLDGKTITANRQSEKAELLRMNLSMDFAGYGHGRHTVTQAYEYVFFKDKVTLYPGEDVQDFFPQLERLDNIPERDTALPSSNHLFKACKTDITLEEMDGKRQVLATFPIGTFYFIPGRKPKGYPYLTNGTARRTFTDSLISISALQQDFTARNLGKLAGHLIDNSNASNPEYIVNMLFRRSTADRTYGERDVIGSPPLELHPVANQQEVIDVIFQNQNLCPDWFSFVGEWELHSELEHSVSENIRHGELMKTDTKRTDKVMLNTGFILEEEAALLTELIESPLCFARIKGQWLRLIPVSKKSMVYNNRESIRSFIVEFQKATDER